jgi:hypothetical protein
MKIIETTEYNVGRDNGVFLQIIQLLRPPQIVVRIKIRLSSNNRSSSHAMIDHWNNGKWESVHAICGHQMQAIRELSDKQKEYITLSKEERLKLYKKDRNNLIRIGADILGHDAGDVLLELGEEESSGISRIEQFRGAARKYFIKNLDENDWDIDDTPVVFIGENGAYVQMWRWFSNEDIDGGDEHEDDE